MNDSVLFEPHPDDAALFAAYTAQRMKPLIVTVLDCGDDRADEARWAARHLGCEVFQWPHPEQGADWAQVRRGMKALAAERKLCFAPCFEQGGHHHHNMTAAIALEVFGERRTIQYLTYVRGQSRTVSSNEVKPRPEELMNKLRALACFESQIRNETTRPWFFDMREYVP